MMGWHRFDQQHDEVRKWAELEGKSPLMSDDLYRRYAPSPGLQNERSTDAALLVRLAAWAVEFWWQFRSR